MTLQEFLSTLPGALRQLDARRLVATPHIYPKGQLLRVEVQPPAGVVLPPLLEPLGVVAVARARDRAVAGRPEVGVALWWGVVDWKAAAAYLGLGEVDATAIAQASDTPRELLLANWPNGAALGDVRVALEAILDQVPQV